MEVDEGLSVDQEGKLLSWMVEFLLWLSTHETFLSSQMISQCKSEDIDVPGFILFLLCFECHLPSDHW